MALALVACAANPNQTPAGTKGIARDFTPLSSGAPPSPSAGCLEPSERVFQTDRMVGGLSALAVNPATGDLVAVSDDADVYLVDLAPDSAGLRLVGRLGGLAGDRPKADLDAESLAVLSDGSWAVSFERFHRLWIYPPGLEGLSGTPRHVPLPLTWQGLGSNRGVEALAAVGDQALLGIEEGSPLQLGGRAVWRIGLDGAHAEGRYRTGLGYVPSAAAEAPDGGILVLERRPLPLGGLDSRIVRLRRSGADFEAGEVLYTPGTDVPAVNYEGLALLPGAGPDWRLVLISDDDDSLGTAVILVTLPACILTGG